jgi:hypothetical protein
MTGLRRTICGSLLAVAWLSDGHAGARQATPQHASDVGPVLQVSVNGGFNGGRASGGLTLLAGTWTEMAAHAGRRSGSSDGLCFGGVSMGVPGTKVGVPHDADPMVAWHVWARLVSMDVDAATVDVRWRREVFGDDLEPSTAREDVQRWRIAEGDTTVLDAVRDLRPADLKCATSSLSVSLGFASAQEFWHAALIYDAWLVQRLPSGETRTHHMRSTGAQGEKVAILFPRVAIPMIGIRDTATVPLDLFVSGGIRGRLRTNGRIDLAVDASRWVMPRGGSMGSGVGGRTHLSVAPGETVEFEPVQIPGGWDGLQYAEIFRQAPTAIRIRASRAW